MLGHWILSSVLVTSQPMGFRSSDLEANSLNLYNSLSVRHMSGTVLTGKVENAGLQLMENVQGRFVSLKVCFFLFLTDFI